jgi:hypothetical protein
VAISEFVCCEESLFVLHVCGARGERRLTHLNELADLVYEALLLAIEHAENGGVVSLLWLEVRR